MSDEEARTAWVGNLDPGSVTDEILYELFLQAGPLQYVRHAKDKATGNKKTFAFICYRSESAVPYAIKLYDGIRLFGRPMKVKNRELEEEQRKQGRNADPQLMGQGIHTLCPTETKYQQPYNKSGQQSHRGNQAMSQQQMNMVITAAGLMGNNPLLAGNNSRMGGGGMMPSSGRNNRNDGRNYGGGASRYLDNESMKNIKKQFDRSDRSPQGSNFNYNRLGPSVEDALGGPVGRSNDYNRNRQNDFDSRAQDALGGPVGKGNDYSRNRQNNYDRNNSNDYRNNGRSPNDNRGNSSRHDRNDYNRGDYDNRGHYYRNSPYDRHSRR